MKYKVQMYWNRQLVRKDIDMKYNMIQSTEIDSKKG
jgi:hypothetical protein